VRCQIFPPQSKTNKQQNKRKVSKTMHQGRPLKQVIAQIKRESEQRKDFRVPTDQLDFNTDGGIDFSVGKKAYAAYPTRHCLRQICARSKIPADYADRMADGHPQLLSDNINYWWQNQPENRMLRTLVNCEHTARAFLSEKYRPLENVDLAVTVMPVLEKLGCEIKSCEVTETRLYLQAVTPRIEAKLVGDKVQAGACIGNSEVGCGSIFEDAMIYTLACKNGMIASRIMGRYHVGRKHDELDDLNTAMEYYSDATREMEDRAFWMKVKDATIALFDKDRFAAMVEAFGATAEQKIKPMKAVEEVTARYRFNEAEKTAVLEHLISDRKGQTLYGLLNAITATASDLEYDRSIEFQRIAGQVMELPKSTWSKN
jgi:hypothetical protein